MPEFRSPGSYKCPRYLSLRMFVWFWFGPVLVTLSWINRHDLNSTSDLSILLNLLILSFLP